MPMKIQGAIYWFERAQERARARCRFNPAAWPTKLYSKVIEAAK